MMRYGKDINTSKTTDSLAAESFAQVVPFLLQCFVTRVNLGEKDHVSKNSRTDHDLRWRT